MTRLFEIGAVVIAGAVALGGDDVAANLLFGGDDAARPEAPAPARSSATQSLENGGFRVAFDYPADWGPGPRDHHVVREAVGRADGVGCGVMVIEMPIAADDRGVPRQLKQMLGTFRKEELRIPSQPGAAVSVTEFGVADVGGQEGRRFALTVKATGAGPAAGAQMAMAGRATFRDYGMIMLMCVAPDGRHRDRDVRAAFDLVFRSFRFTPR